MPPKKGHRLGVDSHRRAKRKGAREQKGSKNRTHHRLWGDGSVFPPRLASRPRSDRSRSLRSLDEAQAPPPAAAPQVPRRRPRRLRHHRVVAKPPPPPLYLMRCNLPRPAPSLPRRPAASHVYGPEPRRQPRCSDCDPRRPCVGRVGASLSCGLARPATPPVRSASAPLQAARPRYGR